MKRLHQATHLLGALAVVESPAAPPGVHLVGGAQRAEAARLLRLLQPTPRGRREATPAGGCDRDGLDVEAQPHAAAGPRAPDPADSCQERAASRGVADELALNAPKAPPPVRRTRRRWARLIARTTRRVLRSARRVASDHRPHGHPTSPGGISARRRIAAIGVVERRTGAPPRRRCRPLATPKWSKAHRAASTVLTWTSSARAISAAPTPAVCRTMASARRRGRAVRSSSNATWSGRTATVRGVRIVNDRGLAGPPAQG
jgi:hypothetical protein